MKKECIVKFGDGEGVIEFIALQAGCTLLEKHGENLPKVQKMIKELKDKEYFEQIRIIGKYVELIPAEDELYNEYMSKRDKNEKDGSILVEILKSRLQGDEK